MLVTDEKLNGAELHSTENHKSLCYQCLMPLLLIRVSLGLLTALSGKAWGMLSALPIAVHSWFIKMCEVSLLFPLR